MKKLVILSTDTSNPFNTFVEQFFKNELPASINDTGSLIESLTTAFISTNKVRYGCSPSPESLVVIRSVIRNCIEKNIPIPILCPWGSKKPKNNESIDIAEVMALKVLSCLQARVQKYYEPGIIVNIRIEDVSGYHLFAGQDGARESSEKYVADFLKLLKILDYNFINPVLESSLIDEQKFFNFAEEIKLHFLHYISETDFNGFGDIDSMTSWKKLQSYGWSGIISVEMRDFYRSQYSKIYGEITNECKNEILSRYFAGSLSRYLFKTTGISEEWGKSFIQLNFAPASPGTPQSIAENRILYRTVPENFARTHIPPWRAKGFLEIGNDYVKPKLTNWFDPESNTFSKASLLFSSELGSVIIQADQKIV